MIVDFLKNLVWFLHGRVADKTILGLMLRKINQSNY